MITRRALFFCFFLTLLTQLILAQKPSSQAQTKSDSGASTTTFDTAPGKIRVILPDDLAAGDAISGTVIAEPSGQTEKEKERNTAKLNGYVIEIENQKSPVSAGAIQRVHLAPGMPAPLLILLDAKGKQIAATPLVVLPSAPATQRTLNLRTLGQSGLPTQIQGPFDGDSANTRITVSGTDAQVIVESPRKVVVQSPAAPVGPGEIKVTKNGATTTGAFWNLRIDLTAPKTSLLKGESTELHVQVSGLEGISQPVKVELQNQSPSTVNIAGGNTQSIVIQPSQVRAGGTFSWSTNLTGTGSGSFVITARVIPDMFGPPSSPAPKTLPTPAPTDTGASKATA